jgi:hypothetical protein
MSTVMNQNHSQVQPGWRLLDMFRMCFVAMLLGLIGSFSLAQTADPPPDQPPPDTTTTASDNKPAESAPTTETQAAAQRTRDIAFLTPILRNAETEEALRNEAAERLLRMNDDDAWAVLRTALADNNPIVTRAILTAIQQHPFQFDPLLGDVLTALRSAPPDMYPRFAWALEPLGDGPVRDLAAMAHDASLTTPQRLGAIYVLGEFHSRESAAAVMVLLDATLDPPSPPDVINAACDAMQRLSGLQLGRNATAWRQWWQINRNLTDEQWDGKLLETAGNRIAQLERRMEQMQQQQQQIMNRLIATYRTLFPLLKIEEQVAGLPQLLRDELVDVRHFAVNRVERLMRDTVELPMEVQHALAERIDDPESAEIRTQAVMLLDRLAYPDLPARVIARLAVEEDPTVAATIIDLLGRRPSPQGLPALTAWLNHATNGGAAADALWKLSDLPAQDAEARALIADSIRLMPDDARTPSHLRLLACVGTDDDRTALEPMLDGEQQPARIAVAEGLARVSFEQPLVDRADDPVLYPHAVRAVALGNPDLTQLRRLISLRRANGNDQSTHWFNAVQTLTNRLPVALINETDITLGELGPDVAPLRIALLRRALTDNGQALNGAVRIDLSIRLANLLVQQNQAQQAHDLLTALNGIEGDSKALNRARFQAAAACGRFDYAAELTADPKAWITFTDTLLTYNVEAARRLFQEINRRFADQLDESMLASLRNLGARLNPPSNPPASPVGTPDSATSDSAQNAVVTGS